MKEAWKICWEAYKKSAEDATATKYDGDCDVVIW